MAGTLLEAGEERVVSGIPNIARTGEKGNKNGDDIIFCDKVGTTNEGVGT